MNFIFFGEQSRYVDSFSRSSGSEIDESFDFGAKAR